MRLAVVAVLLAASRLAVLATPIEDIQDDGALAEIGQTDQFDQYFALENMSEDADFSRRAANNAIKKVVQAGWNGLKKVFSSGGSKAGEVAKNHGSDIVNAVQSSAEGSGSDESK